MSSVHQKGGFLVKVIKAFHSVNLTLFTKRRRNSEKLGNNLEDDRRFKGQKKFISNLYISKIMYTSLETMRVISDIQTEEILEFDYLSRDNLRQD